MIILMNAINMHPLIHHRIQYIFELIMDIREDFIISNFFPIHF